MIRIGIIGLGMMGRTHFEAYKEIAGAEVVAIADTDPKRAAGDLAGTAGNVLDGGINHLPMDRIKGVLNYHELLAMSDVDLVDVCLPTNLHVEASVAALQAGKHVVCEKPLARTSAEAEKIAAAARHSRGLFMPAMCMRFWPEWVWLKNAIVEKTYGNVLSATFRRVSSSPTGYNGWFKDGKISGGAALDLHIHDTDFIQYLFGMPRAVFSRGYTRYSGEIDHLTTHFTYDHIPHVVAEGGWAFAPGFGFSMRYTVNFDSATADFDLGREHQLLLIRDQKSEPVDAGSGFGYAAELRYFLDCVNKRRPPTVVTADDAVRGLKIIEAELRSIRQGTTISL